MQQNDNLIQQLADPFTKRKAFSEVMLQHQQRVYFFIRRMVLDHEDAADVTQNVFLKAWKGIESFRGDSKISTWLFRIAHNESVTFLNKKKKLMGVSLDDLDHSLTIQLKADLHYDGDEIQRELQLAIAKLPEKQKAVFIFRYYENLPYSDISDATGTSVGALKASYHHAVKKIEEHIKTRV
ncbi:MAG: RNA polymerase sigma factor [Flavobacteriales bacterium]